MKLVIKKIVRLSLAGLFALGLTQCTSPKEEDIQQPNILFIAVDDLRPELGCYGNGHIKSPNIDKLAAEGMRFTDHYAGSTVCAPERYSIARVASPISSSSFSPKVS